MKTTCVVIFAFSETEAEYAVDYKINHPEWDVKILPGSIASQLVLLKKLGNPGDYKELLYFDSKNYYDSRIKNFYQESSALFIYALRKLPKYQVLGVDMLVVLCLLIEAEYVTVLHAKHAYELIQEKWAPTTFLFPNNLKDAITGWDPDHFAEAAVMANFFCNSEQIIYFPTTFSQKKSTLSHYLSDLVRSPKRLSLVLGSFFQRIWNKLSHAYVLPRKVDFLIFSHGLHLYYYHKIFAQLKKNPQLSYAVITGWQSLEEETLLRDSQIPFVPLTTFITAGIDKQRVEETTRFRQGLLAKLREPAMVNKIFPRYLPTNLKKALLKKLLLVAEKYGQKFISQIVLTKSVFEHVHPRLMITTHDPGPSAIPFVLLAKKKQIPTLVLQHGLHHVNFSSDYQSDYIASWGKFFQERYVKLLHKDRCAVFQVGFPFLDDLLSSKSSPAQTPVSNKNKQLRLGMLVTLYQIDPFVIPKFFIELFSALKKAGLNSIEVWIRVHSSQNLVQLVTLAQKYNIRCIYNPSLDLEEFIKRCDLVYSWDTTAILWALLYKKPLFYSTPWWGEGYIPVKKYQVGWIPQSAEDFIAYLRRYIDNPQIVKELQLNQEAFFTYVLGVIDGTSSTKHVELFKNILKKDSLPIL